MIQQIIALIIIFYFIFRLFLQKRKNKISKSEFIFWIFFWIVVGVAIVNLKRIDMIVANLGFSGSGIDILLYIGIVVLIYFIFKLRIRLEKIEREITKIVREISLNNKK